jgi:hypothetical protein
VGNPGFNFQFLKKKKKKTEPVIPAIWEAEMGKIEI